MVSYAIVHAFAQDSFKGNPAAVVLLEEWPHDERLQRFAYARQLSETAYLVSESCGYSLRWFTPTVEVDLCGHATLAAAAVLADQGLLADGGIVRFSTRSGPLTASRDRDHFRLDFPVKHAFACDVPTELLPALGLASGTVLRNQFDYLVRVDSAAIVRALSPDFGRLATIECRGVIVTAPDETGEFDFISRFFAPAAGVNEDPVTGSAHCCLVAYWGEILGKSKMRAYQASPEGGVVELDWRAERVLLGGRVRMAEGGYAEL